MMGSIASMRRRRWSWWTWPGAPTHIQTRGRELGAGELMMRLGGAYVGALEMGFTFVLWLSAMKLTTSTARIANLIFLAPFLSLVFIHFVLGEHVVGATVIGLALIVGGLLLQGSDRKTRE